MIITRKRPTKLAKELTYDEHLRLASRIKESLSLLLELEYLYKALRPGGQLATGIRQARKGFSDIRCQLDDELIKDHPDKEWRCVYYGNGPLEPKS